MTGILRYIVDHRLHLLNENIKPLGQLTHFILALYRQPMGQVALAFSNILQTCHHLLERPSNPQHQETGETEKSRNAEGHDNGDSGRRRFCLCRNDGIGQADHRLHGLNSLLPSAIQLPDALAFLDPQGLGLVGNFKKGLNRPLNFLGILNKVCVAESQGGFLQRWRAIIDNAIGELFKSGN